MNDMTPADVMAMTKENDGIFGGNGFFAIIILFFIWAMFGNNAAANGALTRAEMQDGFNNATVQNNQSDLMRGQFDLQKEIMQNRYDAQIAACGTGKEILENRFATQMGFNNLTAAMCQNCSDIKNAIHNDGEMTRALITQNTIQELRDNLQAAQLTLGNAAQTQTLLAAINPVPRPAYITASPYASLSGCGCC